ncbi:ABC transporter substrate-binding protein [Magnetococcus sp. PR-3]|uniref:ABC transporter substrate-binding protein n=1 Tax=Magnetococcus sp. PR-3 TaxID=3120355 RepID=UPI002FCE66E1
MRGVRPAVFILTVMMLAWLHPVMVHAQQQTLHFSLSRLGEPQLDPHRSQGDLELHLNVNLFEGLMKLDPATGELQPALATGYRWLSPTIIEFDLRQGVLFHNGEPFNAQAVKFSFDRMAKVKKGFNWIKAIIPEFDRVEVITPYRIRIHFKKHNSIFLISSRFFVILPPKLLQEKGVDAFMSHPVGTGPFIYQKRVEKPEGELQIHLKRNPDHWSQNGHRLNHVVVYYGLDQKHSLERLLDGRLDAMADLPIRRLLKARKGGFQTPAKGQGLISWLYFNLTQYKADSPIWDPRVRQAIAHAIDYKRILRVVYRNRAQINQQWAFPGLPGHVADLPDYAYDPQRARDLLQQAQVPQGLRLNMYCDDVSLDEAKIVRSSLGALGIDVHIDVLDEATNNCILTAKNQPNSPCHKKLKFYDMMMGDFGWGLPHNYVSHLHTFSLESFASLVADDYPDAQRTVTLFQTAKAAFGQDAATRQWEEITRYEHKRLGILGVALKQTYYAIPPHLNWPVYGAYDFSNAYLQPSAVRRGNRRIKEGPQEMSHVPAIKTVEAGGSR